ncbi:MAG: hypothetical protein EOO04_30290, partial [Chitinophagaceae bacterium]
MKVIYLVEGVYSAGLLNNYYKEEWLIRDGYDVEIWSLVDRRKFGDKVKAEAPHVKYFDEVPALCKALKNLATDYMCFIQLQQSHYTFPIFKAALQYARKCAMIDYLSAQTEFSIPPAKEKERYW